ncbi:hypothetical protein ACOSQ2_007607 [Xanthoceras sorbifolium]
MLALILLIFTVNSEKYSPVILMQTIEEEDNEEVTIKNNVMLQKKAGEVEKDEENLEYQKEYARNLNFSRR